MFEKEEGKLTDYKKSYENIPVPMEAIDDAIFAGFHKAKLETIQKPKRKKWMYSVAVAAIILFGFFASVRFSPAFANYITVIPGMEKIVELIRYDKGMMSAIENEYYQEIGVTVEKEGLEITLDGAIEDENGLVLFYTVKGEKPVNLVNLDKPELKTKEGERVQYSTAGFSTGSMVGESTKTESGTVDFFFDEPLQGDEFVLSFDVIGSYKKTYSFPFTLKEQVMSKKVYELNKTVTIAGQKITIELATIQPLRTAIHVKMDPNNTMRILDFPDIRLVDENGEVWNKIANGITSSSISDNEKVFYLQSNYFRDPEELYIVFNKLQAIDKDEEFVVVDVESEQIVKQPDLNIFTKVTVDQGNIGFYMEDVEEEFNFFSPFGVITDADGNTIEPSYWYSHGGQTDQFEAFGVNILNLEEIKSPLTFEISFFPNWIEGNAKVKIE